MGRNYRSKSRLVRLPKPILEQVNTMLMEVGEERKTYEEIAAWVKDQGYETSKSSIQRYARWVAALERIKLVGEQARTIIEEAGQDPLRIEEATAKLGAVVMMEVFQEAMKGDRIDVAHIGRLMGDFARLQTSSVNRERLKAVTLNQIERAAKEMPGEKMTPEELVKFIKERVYGL
jgi:enamine deaminase RidA (YjgF/YER057c/UK114 family)